MPTLQLTLTEGDQTLASLQFDTQLELATLLQRIPELLRPEGRAPNKAAEPAGLSAVGQRYRPLASYLDQHSGPQVNLTFKAIEDILGKGQKLPPTARGDHARAWWSNSTSHSQGIAWLAVGWRVTALNTTKGQEEVQFTRS